VDEPPWYEEVVIPALLRHARATYGKAMRAALEEAGYDDLPANALYVIGGLVLQKDVPLRELIRQLGISKQGAGQLVDSLVTRGYLSRTVDKNDRRKLVVSLTERGRAAADIQREARERIDAELIERAGVEDVRAMRRALGALISMRHEEAQRD
jgi:DNA-binding MarR family transcriptional regulator